MVADNVQKPQRLMEPIQGTLTPPGAEGEPRVLRLSTKRPKHPETRVPLFYIDDVAYEVLEKPKATMGLKYLWLMKTEGQEAATLYMLTALLGADGYTALMNYDDLTQEEYDEVISLATKIMVGSTEAPKVRQNGQRV